MIVSPRKIQGNAGATGAAIDDRRQNMYMPPGENETGKKEAAASRGSRKKDTEMPPIERVQGPDIKGMR
jgi:hypothetical protein